jgi:FKBP-type peptidyl-prolyl cis-trans isomerase
LAAVGGSDPTGPKAYQTRSGLRYIDTAEGSGVSPKFGQLIAFNYEMYYRPPPPGKVERIDWTSRPFLHKHGNGRLCRGLDEALHTMRVGGSRRAILSPEIGYVEFGVGPLPSDPSRRKRYF